MRNLRIEIISRLRESGKAVIIYGSGKFAISVAKYVIENNVDIYCFCDCEKYFYKGKKVFVDVGDGRKITYDVIDNQEMQKIHSKFNILLGMIDYSLLSHLRDLCQKSDIVEYLDVFPSHIMTTGYVKRNANQLKKVYSILEDEESREVMKCFIMARLTGDVKGLCKHNKSPFTYDFGLLKLNSSDVIVDGGAYVGDTIAEISEYLDGKIRRIAAFEPDKKNFAALCKNYESDIVHCYNFGIWSKTTTLKFENAGTLGSKINEEANDIISVISLDDFRSSGQLEDVTMIKMDIEGSELEALKGCIKLLQKEKPKLAICIYHNNEDIVSIPIYLMENTGGGISFF